MGSILNFILPYKENEYPEWCIEGPITYKIYDNFSYTFFPEIKENCKNYFLIEPSEALKAFIYNIDYLKDNNIIEFIYKNNITLILSSIADPPHQDIYNEVVKQLKIHNLENNTIFLSSNMGLTHLKNVYCFNYFISDFLESKNLLYGETDLGYISEEITEKEINIFRNKKFLSFNKTIDKQHRFSLYHDYLTNDFSDSYFSFLNLEGTHCEPYQHPLLELETYLNKLPIELDTNGKTQFTAFNTMKKNLFLDSCIHIVTETSFHHNELFVSEKVLKPILNYQPFIVLGPVGYLGELKRLGLKTFSDFWDESYDEIEDPKERYLAVSKLILELNSKSIEEINKLYQKTKDIIIYNKDYLNNLELTELNDFLKNL